MANPTRIHPDRIREYQELRSEGLTFRAIGARFNRSSSTVIKALKRIDPLIGNERKIKQGYAPQVKLWYEAGFTFEEIQRMFGISKDTIDRYLGLLNVSVRRRGDRPPKDHPLRLKAIKELPPPPCGIEMLFVLPVRKKPNLTTTKLYKLRKFLAANPDSGISEILRATGVGQSLLGSYFALGVVKHKDGKYTLREQVK